MSQMQPANGATTQTPASSPLRSLALAVAPVIAASALGQIATMPNLTPWYASLIKPGFNPPNWLFGPVWTLLYVLMAYAFFRILRAPASDARRSAITLFLIQIALNAAWSWGFFAAHSPLLGLAIIVPLLVMIVLTIRAFARIDMAASLLLYPYAGWVGFATMLNASIWLLNR